MLKNYLLLTLRNMVKHKSYWFINTLGLAAGLICCLLIAVYIYNELSYDHFHTDGDRIFRISTKLERPDRPSQSFASTPYPLAEVIREEVPGIEACVRLKQYRFFVENGDNRFQEDKFFFADSSFFDVFTFRLSAGNPDFALDKPFSVILTANSARKYFGSEDPLGQVIVVEDTIQLTVTGIFADDLRNSHLDFEFLASFETLERLNILGQYPWWSFNFYTYVKAADATSVDGLDEQILKAAEPHLAARSAEIGSKQNYSLQPIGSIYLDSKLQVEIGRSGERIYIQMASIVALLVLIIACINFVNLTIAHSMGRAKEVAMRKTMGANRTQLMRQFLLESMVMTCLAYLIAVTTVALTLPHFSHLLDKQLTFSPAANWEISLAMTAIILMVGLSAGIYPALILSAHSPVSSSGAGMLLRAKTRLRRGLIVLQYSATAFLFIATIIVYRQLTFMQNENLGYAKEQILVVDAQRNSGMLGQNYEFLKQNLLEVPGVTAASASSSVPGRGLSKIVFRPDAVDATETQSILTLTTDHDFLATYGIDLVAGRAFSRDFATDPQSGFIVNEAAVASLGWGTPEDAIGRDLIWGWPGKPGKVVGVVRNFHQLGLRHPFEPILMHIQPGWFNFLSLRISGQDIPGTVAQLGEVWQRVVPNRPFDFTFLDESFDRQYRSEVSVGRLFGLFSGLAVVLAGIGLLSLTMFIIEFRTKEIAMRKVLGASVMQIWTILARQFFALVSVAMVIAAPVGYWLMKKWLEGFAFHTQLDPEIFLLAGMGLLACSLLMIAYHTGRAALANPVDGLRNE